jgi:hypothetical protein
MDFLKSITGKVVTGFIALAVIVAAVSWWQLDPASRSAIIGGTGRVLGWLGVVLILPWTTFFLIGRVAKLESNAAGAALVAGYTILELVLLGWMLNWKAPSMTVWIFAILGGLFAAAYNLLTCDWIAEKVA